MSEVRVRWQGPGGCGLGADLGDGRFWHTGQNTGSSCFSFARPASGAPVAVMTDAEDCRDTLVALIEMAQRHHGRTAAGLSGTTRARPRRHRLWGAAHGEEPLVIRPIDGVPTPVER